MAFDNLPRDLKEFRQYVRDYAETNIKPHSFRLDRDSEFPAEIVKDMQEKGFLSLIFDEEWGGAGLSQQHYSILSEEICRVDVGVGVIVGAHMSLGTWGIQKWGTEEQKEKYLRPLLDGRSLGGFGLTEENAGSDSAGTETTAEDMGDYYLLNGKKIYISNAPIAQTYLITAVTEPGIGNHGISMFIVDKDFEGFTFSEPYDKMGIRSSITAELRFNNVKVPKENLLGELGKGFKQAMIILDSGRIGVGAMGLGIAQGSFESARAFTLQREQFGRPIAAFQNTQFMLADMATKIHAGRLMIEDASKKKDNGEPYSKEAAMVKLYCTDLGQAVANDAVQLYGGAGFIKGTDVERFYRDSKITQIFEGTNQIQRGIIASHILPKPEKREQTKEKKSIVGDRKKQIFKGQASEVARQFVEALKNDGYTFDNKSEADTNFEANDRVVVAGMGVGEEEKMELVHELARETGAAVGATRPVSENKQFLPLDRYIGISGQKYQGDLYIGLGVSGSAQHLSGIKDVKTICVINNSENAPFFKNCDYGIVGDINEVVPAIIEEIKKA